MSMVIMLIFRHWMMVAAQPILPSQTYVFILKLHTGWAFTEAATLLKLLTTPTLAWNVQVRDMWPFTPGRSPGQDTNHHKPFSKSSKMWKFVLFLEFFNYAAKSGNGRSDSLVVLVVIATIFLPGLDSMSWKCWIVTKWWYEDDAMAFKWILIISFNSCRWMLLIVQKISRFLETFQVLHKFLQSF